METGDQKLAAYLLGRMAAAEKALQTIIGSPRQGGYAELLQANFPMRREMLGKDLIEFGLPDSLLPEARTGFVAQERMVYRGLQGGRFVPLAPKER